MSYGRFIRLKDVKNYINKRVNLLGVVLEFSIPRSSQGTVSIGSGESIETPEPKWTILDEFEMFKNKIDVVSVLKIVDESQNRPEFSVSVFAQSFTDLPHIKSAHDLILLHHVLITMYNGEPCATFSKKYSTFALFHRTAARGNCSPYQIFPQNVNILRNQDRYFINSLRDWSLSFDFNSGTSDYLVSIKDISEGDFFDIVCKVVHICEDRYSWILFVWDGTDTPSLSLKNRLEEEEQQPLSLQIESQPLQRAILCNFPSIGTVLRVSVDPTFERIDSYFQGDSRWVRLRNMTCDVKSGLWKGQLVPGSKIRLLSDNDKIVVERERDFAERKRRTGHAPMHISPSSCSVTDLHFSMADEYGFASLMDVLTCRQINTMFKCIVRVVAVSPCQVKEISSLIGSNEYNNLRLTLEDPTSRLHAYIWSKEKVKFFEDDISDDLLTSKMNNLLGVSEDCDSPRNPPWIKCLIKLRNFEINGVQDVRFYICYTKLV